ncbi:MAG TPA: DUF5684 domain-containing protein [Bacteroidia bacterium]|jgi:hypothetical protein|nr:DUF5684 domain-containing protein [Bacteroidia bacterium]
MASNQAPFVFFATLIVLMLTIVITIVSRMLIFEKAGRSNVSAFIPFLNFYVMLRLAGMRKGWTLLYFMTLVNLYLGFKTLRPFLLPDVIYTDHLNFFSFFFPFLHPGKINLLFVVYWIFNWIYLYIYIRLHVRLAGKFHKSTLFGWGMALLEPVFYPVLAFGKAEYKE